MALIWLASANLHNAAQAMPMPGIPVAMCLGGHVLYLPVGPAGQRHDHRCEGACHAACRRQTQLPEATPDDCC